MESHKERTCRPIVSAYLGQTLRVHVDSRHVLLDGLELLELSGHIYFLGGFVRAAAHPDSLNLRPALQPVAPAEHYSQDTKQENRILPEPNYSDFSFAVVKRQPGDLRNLKLGQVRAGGVREDRKVLQRDVRGPPDLERCRWHWLELGTK